MRLCRDNKPDVSRLCNCLVFCTVATNNSNRWEECRCCITFQSNFSLWFWPDTLPENALCWAKNGLCLLRRAGCGSCLYFWNFMYILHVCARPISKFVSAPRQIPCQDYYNLTLLSLYNTFCSANSRAKQRIWALKVAFIKTLKWLLEKFFFLIGNVGFVKAQTYKFYFHPWN